MSILDDILNTPNRKTPEPQYHKGSIATVEAMNNTHNEETLPPPVIQAPQEEDTPITTYRDVVKPLAPKELTTEELEKEKKRERTKSILSAVADGVSSFANLYYTGKGALSTPQSSMTEATASKYKELLERRKVDKEKYDHMYLNAFGNDMRLNENRAVAKQQQSNWERSNDKEEQRYNDNLNYRIRKDAKDDKERLEERNMRKEQFEYKKSQDKEANALNTKVVEGKLQSYKKDKSPNMSSIAYTDPKDNTVKTLDFPKSKSNSLLSLYEDIRKEIKKQQDDYTVAARELKKQGIKDNQLAETLAKRGLKNPTALEDIKISMGEGGDSMSKAMTILSRRMPEFPQLSRRLFQLIGDPTEAPTDNKTVDDDLGLILSSDNDNSIDYEQHMKTIK